MTAPEPWRELDPPPGPWVPGYRFKDNNVESELSWGPGLIPHYLNYQPPSQHGQYMPKCPRTELRGFSLTPVQKIRPPDEVKGYAGDQIAD
jgi:hypothetical protein